MTQEFLNSIARHCLTKFAGVLVTHGYMTNADTETFLGFCVFALGLLWSYFEKKRGAGNDGAPPTTGRLSVSLASVCLCATLCLSGCSTPQRAVYNYESAAVLTVDSAMTAWGHYVGEFHPPVEQELAVQSAFVKYQTALAVAIDAARAWASLGTNGPPIMDPSFQAHASDSLADLFHLITLFQKQ